MENLQALNGLRMKKKMSNNKQTYADWKKVVDKLEKDVKNAEDALIAIEIAREGQSHLLEFAKKRLAKYPEPEKIMMECKKEGCTKEAEEGKDFCDEHKEETPAE